MSTEAPICGRKDEIYKVARFSFCRKKHLQNEVRFIVLCRVLDLIYLSLFYVFCGFKFWRERGACEASRDALLLANVRQHALLSLAFEFYREKNKFDRPLLPAHAS